MVRGFFLRFKGFLVDNFVDNFPGGSILDNSLKMAFLHVLISMWIITRAER
jgi:hypothetical protein